MDTQTTQSIDAQPTHLTEQPLRFSLRWFFLAITLTAIQCFLWASWGLAATVLLPAVVGLALTRQLFVARWIAYAYSTVILITFAFALIFALSIGVVPRESELLFPLCFAAIAAYQLIWLRLASTENGILLALIGFGTGLAAVGVGGFIWLEAFNRFNATSPHWIIVAIFGLAVSTVASWWATLRQFELHLAIPWRIRLFAIATASALAVATTPFLYERAQRFRSQRAAAAHLTDRGAWIQWNDWWVVHVTLSADEFDVSHLAMLKSFPNLRSLNAWETPIEDADIADICEIERLETLMLWGTDISDDGLPLLRTCPNLRVLRLAGTGVTDVGLAELVSMPTLEELDLAGTNVTDQGLGHIAKMNGLHKVRFWSRGLKKRYVTQDAIQALRRARPDLEIY